MEKNGIDYIKEINTYKREGWFRHLVDLVISKKGYLSESERNNILNVLCGVTDDEIDINIKILNDTALEENDDINYIETISIMKMYGFENVNALVDGVEVNFSPRLTVFYGRNGSGKSSYFRSLSCFSKSPKQIKGFINDKVNNDDKEKVVKLQYCKYDDYLAYNYQKTEVPQINCTVWKSTNVNNKISIKEKLHFYDFENVDIIINRGRDLNWKLEPFKLHYFEIISEEINKLQLKCDEIINNNTSKINTITQELKNNFFFIEIETIVKLLLNGENENTIFRPLSHEEKKTLQELQENYNLLKRESYSDRLKLIKQLRFKLDSIISLLKDIEKEEDIIKKLKSAEEEYITFKELYDRNKLDQLLEKNVQYINIQGWKDFIIHALEIVEGYNYPKENDRCIFCNQTLSAQSIELIKKYDQIFNSKYKNDLKAREYKFENLKIELNRIQQQKNIFEQEYFYLNDIIKEVYEVKEAALMKEIELTSSIKNMTGKDIRSLIHIIETIYIDKVDKDIELLNNREVNREHKLNYLNKQISQYEEREFIAENKAKFKIIADIKLSNDKLINISTLLSSQKATITKKETEAKTALQLNKYEKLFKSELKKFNFKLDIENKIRKGKLGRKIYGEEVDKILSEGEKNVIGLADFLAEVNYYDNDNNPIILDDPITSFDAERIEMIAERLVTESKKRQVIVFTHNKPFVLAIKDKIDFIKNKTKCKCKLCQDNYKCNDTNNIYCTKMYEIYSLNGMSGFCIEILPVNETKAIKDKIENIITKPESSAIDVLEGYLLLRVLIEYFIDNYLLKSVRSRLNPESDTIPWDNLSKIVCLRDDDGREGSLSIVREKYSKLSSISIHIDKRKQGLPYGKPQLIEDLNDLRTKNSKFKEWYDNL